MDIMRKLLITCFSVFSAMVHGQLLNPQSSEVTERFYPDPDIEIPTPAFSGDKVKFTSHEEMMGFLNGLVAEHPELATINFIGESQKGEEIPMVTLSKGGNEANKLRVYMQGGLHGDEPGSTEAMLYLIHQILNVPEYTQLLDRLTIAVVPMANVDGCDAHTRDAANGLDLNRDQTKLMAPESVALKLAFHAFQPHVAVDFHEYRPHRRDFQLFGKFGVNGSYDVMFLYSGNLNVPESLRNFTKDQFVTPAKQSLDDAGLSHHDYFSTRDVRGAVVFSQGSINARSSATNFALSNVISTLIEVRGVGLGTTSFKRRVNSSFLVASSYLKTAFNNVDMVKKVLSETSNNTSEAVIEVERPLRMDHFAVIDNADRELIQIEASVSDAWEARAVSTRARPSAYFIPEGNREIVDRLHLLGLKTTVLSASTTLTVQEYVVSDYWRDAYLYEQMHRQDVVAELRDVEVELPAGTIVVDMSQPGSSMAIEVLEPETANSFVSFGVIETQQGATLPYYRFMNQLPIGVRTNNQ